MPSTLVRPDQDLLAEWSGKKTREQDQENSADVFADELRAQEDGDDDTELNDKIGRGKQKSQAEKMFLSGDFAAELCALEMERGEWKRPIWNLDLSAGLLSLVSTARPVFRRGGGNTSPALKTGP
jgi:hypothetical protein